MTTNWKSPRKISEYDRKSQQACDERRGELWRWRLGAQQPHSVAAILHMAIAGSDGHKDLAALTIYMVLYSYLPSSKENQETIPQNPLQLSISSCHNFIGPSITQLPWLQFLSSSPMSPPFRLRKLLYLLLLLGQRHLCCSCSQDRWISWEDQESWGAAASGQQWVEAPSVAYRLEQVKKPLASSGPSHMGTWSS